MSGDERALADLVEARLRERAPRARDRADRATTSSRAPARAPTHGSCSAATSTRCRPTTTRRRARDGDTLHGLGSADMKGGLAVLLDARRVARRAPARARRHARLLRGRRGRRRAQRAAAAVRRTARPRRGRPRGPARADRRLDRSRLPGNDPRPRRRSHGARAHSARPWMGVNAVHRAAPMLARIAAHEAPTVTVDGLDYRESLQVVRVEGGHRQQRRARSLRDRREPPLRAGVLARRRARASATRCSTTPTRSRS